MRMLVKQEKSMRLPLLIYLTLTNGQSRFKGMSVDDFLDGGFMNGEEEDEVLQSNLWLSGIDI